MMATLGAAFNIKDMGAPTVADRVRLSHEYLRLICIDDSRCPTFHRHGTVLCRHDDAK
jgi:hypothetical protein